MLSTYAVPGEVPLLVVIGQHPGRRGPDIPEFAEGLVDHLADGFGVPGCVEEVEVERRVQLVRAQVLGESIRVGHPCFGTEDPVPCVLVDDRPPTPVDVVHLVAIPVGVLVGVRRGQQVVARPVGYVGEVGILGKAVRDVDPEPVDAQVQPKPQDVLELVDDLRVGPVQVRLFRREQVQIPLPVGDPGPGRSAEVRRPVVRRQRTVRAAAVAKDVAAAFVTVRAGRQRGLEPLVLVGCVVRHQVDNDPQSVVVRFTDQRLGVVQGAENRVDVAVVGHVVTSVSLR